MPVYVKKGGRFRQVFDGLCHKANQITNGWVFFRHENDSVQKIKNPAELSTARYNLTATTIGDYALFSGSSVVDAYDKNLTRSTPTALSQGRYALAATAIGDYALFGGGVSGLYSSVVDAYDKNLTHSTPTDLSKARAKLAATAIGDYALFGGGEDKDINNVYSYFTVVDAYDKNLTRSKPTALSQARCNLAAIAIGDYALFGGGAFGYSAVAGEYDANFAVVDAYDKNLTRSTPTALSQARYNLAATAIGDYALFGGGEDRKNSFAVVDAYDKNLTRSTPTALSKARYILAATAIGDYALFGGGGYYISVVEAYDKNLTRSMPPELSKPRGNLAATTVGDYGLFGGGYYRNSAIQSDYGSSAIVDAYKLTNIVPISFWNIFFKSLSQGRYELAATAIGDYALFGGGYGLGSMDAYNKNLTHSTPTELSRDREDLAATAIGDYALFGGGGSGSSMVVVDAYDKNLTRSTPTALSQGRYALAATVIGDYALFGGGKDSNTECAIVDAYDKNLTRSTPTVLSQARYDLAATAIEDYALFGGGRYSNFLSVVDAYDKNLTRSIPTALSQEIYGQLAATAIEGYALFGGGGGRLGDTYYATQFVNAYDKKLTRSTPAELSQARYDLAATAIRGHALFGGGTLEGSAHAPMIYYSSVVDAYDENLTRSTLPELSYPRTMLAATAIGDYALFGGGGGRPTFSANTDAYRFKKLINRFEHDFDTTLPSGRKGAVLGKTGQYVLIGSGKDSMDAPSNVVTAISKIGYVQSVATVLYAGLYGMAGSQTESYALFSGGRNETQVLYVTQFYTDALATNYAANMTVPRFNLAAQRIGEDVLLAGGENLTEKVNAVESYNNTLTLTIRDTLLNPRAKIIPSSTSKHAIFAGGETVDGISDIVEVYDAELTRSIAPSLSAPSDKGVGVTFRDKAIFMTANSKYLDVYDTELVRTKAYLRDTQWNHMPAATATKDYIVACLQPQVSRPYYIFINENLVQELKMVDVSTVEGTIESAFLDGQLAFSLNNSDALFAFGTSYVTNNIVENLSCVTAQKESWRFFKHYSSK